MNRRKIAALVGAFALVLTVASVAVYAAGPGTFAINVNGSGAQQGVGNVTGVCQAGQPVAATLDYGWDATSSAFVVTDVALDGINPVCTSGTLVVNDQSFTFSVSHTGNASVPLSPAPPVGGFDSMALLLTE